MRFGGLFGFQLGQVGLVPVQDRLLQGVPRLRGNGVGNIPERPVFIFSAGHGNK